MSASTPETSAVDCLLVVDDQESNIQVLGSMLGKIGFEILPATSSEQAFKRLETRRPDLILLDLLMPGMDGFELCRRIQENPEWAQIPIIFLSAADDKNLIVRALESGGVDYITKPFNKLELISRVRTHLALKSTRDHLERLAQDKEELIGIISHHLQNHLAGINMSTQLLLERARASQDKKVGMLAENIHNASGQARSFVKTFLANAYADHGLSLKLVVLDLAEVVERISLQHKDTAAAKGITVRKNFPSGTALVRVDSSAVEQAVDNLISNAVKFSPSGTEITLTVRVGSQFVECEVRDQGPGFTDEDRQRMFQRYSRLSARPTAGEPSTGLGLSIVKKLVDAMNGEITCEINQGKGAAFIMKFSAAKP